MIKRTLTLHQYPGGFRTVIKNRHARVIYLSLSNEVKDISSQLADILTAKASVILCHVPKSYVKIILKRKTCLM